MVGRRRLRDVYVHINIPCRYCVYKSKKKIIDLKMELKTI